MSDEAKPSGMGAGKIVLIVVLCLVVLGLICCGAAWSMGLKYAWQFGRGSMELATQIQSDVGKDATMNFFPDDEGRMVLVVGVPEELTPERAAEIQDKTWKAYANAFADGGFDLAGVGVGKPGAGQGTILGWKKQFVSTADVVARTGVAAPPKAEWIEKIEAEQRAKIEIRSKESEPEEVPEPAEEGAPK